ncbi:MAG TPA: type II CAAX endopeptidase family protein [Anaerolineales bacterium]|nr:type II CAAX endopeptidase family protein [Anaerolineales bacterium]
MNKKTILAPLGLFLVALILRSLDIFVFRLDELLGEIILSKFLGLALVVGYVWWAGRKLKVIGFHTQALCKSLLLGGLTVSGLFALAYGVQVLAINAGGEQGTIVLSAIDPKTSMAGGFAFGLWLILDNVVNAAMEEGLFRGVMLTHFAVKFSPWKALGLQALLFASWHLVWPLKHFLTGEVDTSQAAFEAVGLFISTGIGGLVFGWLYYKTNNIWSAFLAHFINNTILNVIFIQTAEGLQSGVEFGLFLTIWLPGYLALIPLISRLAKKYSLPQFITWESENAS